MLTIRLRAPHMGPGFADFVKSIEEALRQAMTRSAPARDVDADTPLSVDDGVLYVDATAGPVDIVLPPAAALATLIFTVKKTDASGNAVTLVADGGETIDGAGTAVIAMQYDNLTIHSSGLAWWVI